MNFIFWLFLGVFSSALSSIEFPRDHSFHKDFKLEWCYFIGNLKSNEGIELGYELSFFKAYLNEKEEVFPVHFAISEIKEKKHTTVDVLHRKFGSMASYSPTKIRSGDFQILILSSTQFEILANPRGSSQGLHLKLSVDSPKEILIQGEGGISQKSRKYPNIFSYYYSIPRLKTNGMIRTNSREYQISEGTSWMDHEWSSPLSQREERLGSKESQWDWVCMNLEDGTDIMVFNFRHSQQEKSESFGTIRNAEGKVQYFHEEGMVTMTPGNKQWKSPKTNKTYPMGWNVNIGDYTLEISPTFESQEFLALKSTRNSYWEGGVRIQGSLNGKPILGKGYLELK
jgi:predicted secreted hydrolase